MVNVLLLVLATALCPFVVTDAACANTAMPNCQTCESASASSCDTCSGTWGNGIDKVPLSSETCDCRDLPIALDSAFLTDQSNLCAIARPVDFFALVAAMNMSVAESAEYRASTLMGCVGPKANSIIVTQATSTEARYGTGDTSSTGGPCHPDPSVSDAVVVLYGLTSKMYSVGRTVSQGSASGTVKFDYIGANPTITVTSGTFSASGGTVTINGQPCGTPSHVSSGQTLKNCANPASNILRLDLSELVEVSEWWESASTASPEVVSKDLNSAFGDSVLIGDTRTCKFPHELAAVSHAEMEPVSGSSMMMHSTIFKADTFSSARGVNMAELTGRSLPMIKYWREDAKLLSRSISKPMEEGSMKVSAGINSFPWSIASTADSLVCFVFKVEKALEDGTMSTNLLNQSLVWFDNNTQILYVPLMSGSEYVANYTECKSAGSGTHCYSSMYTTFKYSRFLFTNTLGNWPRVAKAEYRLDDESGQMYACATKTDVGSAEFAFDQVIAIGRGPLLPSSPTFVEIPTENPSDPSPALVSKAHQHLAQGVALVGVAICLSALALS